MPPVFGKAEKFSVPLDGNKLAVYRWNKNTGPRILIVHGFESSASSFDRYIEPLLRNGFEVVSFDAPAHGESEGKRVTLPLFVKAIEAVLLVTGPAHGLMAHSFGGLAVMHYLENYPAANQCRVALIAPATESSSAVESLFLMLQLNDKVRVEFEKIVIEKGFYPFSHYSIRRILQRISPTILWIHDEDDDVTPLKDVLPIKSAAPENIEFMITSGWGHRRIYRENKVLKKVVGFLGVLSVSPAEHRHE